MIKKKTWLDSGKPQIANSNLQISIAHSRTLLLMTIGQNIQGCDLEFVEQRTLEQWLELLGNQSQTFLQQFKNYDDTLCSFATRLWCVKESIFKATGIFPQLITVEMKSQKGVIFTAQVVNNSFHVLTFPVNIMPVFPFIYPNLTLAIKQTLGNFLDSIIKDQDLKLLLCGNMHYYHTNPYTLSFLFYSFAQSSYFYGSWFIKGGSQVLSNYLASVIKEHNGEILLSHLVTKIMTNKGKAIGIECESKPKKTVKQFFAQTIIANAAIPNIVNLLPAPENNLLQKQIKNCVAGCTFISIYLGFKKEISQLGNLSYSMFRFNDDIHSLDDININNTSEYEKRNFTFVDYSQIDSGLTPSGKSTGCFFLVDHLSDWEGLSLEEYKKKKESIAQIALDRLEKEIPGIRKEVEYYEVATSKTIQRYTLNPQGTPYGFAAIPSQAGLLRQPNKSPIPGLYFASAWTYPGHGFTGTIIGGYLCAKEVHKFLNIKIQLKGILR